jgi:hypothetical protein
VHNEPCPGLLLVPLEASEVGLFQLVVRLERSVLYVTTSQSAYLLLELLVDGV